MKTDPIEFARMMGEQTRDNLRQRGSLAVHDVMRSAERFEGAKLRAFLKAAGPEVRHVLKVQNEPPKWYIDRIAHAKPVFTRRSRVNGAVY